jgi:hypothetical protein
VSAEAKDWARSQRPGNLSAKALLMELADRADKIGRCWPSQKTLAKSLNCCERTVRHWLDWLEVRGLIKRTRRNNKYGYRSTDLITLQVASAAPSCAKGEAKRSFLPAGDGGANRQPIHNQPANTAAQEMNPSEESKERSLRSLLVRARGSTLGQCEVRPAHPATNQTPEPNRNRATRLAENWQPSEDDKTFAVREGLSRMEVDREADRFRDYRIAKAGAGACKLDWSATWRNWARRAVDLKRGGARAIGPPKRARSVGRIALDELLNGRGGDG